MKYTELKSSLKQGLNNNYLIYGDDRYLCFDALKKIEARCEIKITDMNSVSISGESCTVREVVDSLNVYPFGDALRLVVVRNLPALSKDHIAALKAYVEAPLASTIFVLFCPEKPEIFGAMPNITPIDCSKIDPKIIESYVKNEFAKNDIRSSSEAISKLVSFCGGDMTRVSGETEKLIAYALDSKEVSESLVEKLVTQDKEYQAYQLAQFIARGDAARALELIDLFMVKTGAGFQILSPLYNNYRRALYISVNKDKSAAELASLLGVKEYAVKMLVEQTKIFSSKKLKTIVDMIADADKKIKVGQIKENVAIKAVVFNILNLRGQ